MEDNSLFLDLNIRKKNLLDIILPLIESYTSQNLEIESYNLKLHLPTSDKIKLTANNQKVFLTLPLGFNIVKPDGIFSIEADGEIQIDLCVNCDLDQYFTLRTKTELIDFQWNRNPIVKIGQFSLGVEKIAECIIRFVKDNIIAKVDQTISNNIDIQSELTNQLQKIGNNILIHKKPNLYYNFKLLQIQTTGFVDDGDDIQLHLYVEIANKISDEIIGFEQNHDPRFFWIEKEPRMNQHVVEIQLSYVGLAKAIMENINGQDLGGKKFEIDNINIRYTNGLEIKAALFAPVKAILTIQGKPTFDRNSQQINVLDTKIDIDAHNILYKLSSPLIEKLIANRLEQLLPINITSSISPYLDKLSSIEVMDRNVQLNPHLNGTKVDQMEWTSSHLIVRLILERAEVDIEV